MTDIVKRMKENTTKLSKINKLRDKALKERDHQKLDALSIEADTLKEKAFDLIDEIQNE